MDDLQCLCSGDLKTQVRSLLYRGSLRLVVGFVPPSHSSARPAHIVVRTFGLFSVVFLRSTQYLGGFRDQNGCGQRICCLANALSTAILVTKTPQILGRTHDSMCRFVKMSPFACPRELVVTLGENGPWAKIRP